MLWPAESWHKPIHVHNLVCAIYLYQFISFVYIAYRQFTLYTYMVKILAAHKLAYSRLLMKLIKPSLINQQSSMAYQFLHKRVIIWVIIQWSTLYMSFLKNWAWPCWLANSSGSPLLWFLHPANPASRKRKVCNSLKNQGFFLQRFVRECKQRKEIKSNHVYLCSFLHRTTHAAQPVAWQLPKVKLCKTGGQLVTFLMTFAKAYCIHTWA